MSVWSLSGYLSRQQGDLPGKQSGHPANGRQSIFLEDGSAAISARPVHYIWGSADLLPITV
jgi:hypothetical protein